jgi:hypothetical protein
LVLFFSKKELLASPEKPLDSFLQACYGLFIRFIPTKEGLMKIVNPLPAIGMLTRGMFTAV